MNKLHKISGLLAALFLNSIVLFAQQADVGLSNYYSDALQGNPTAYGEIYDRTQYTASHRTYPKGTLLKVTRLDNSKSVIVRVNDRGPFSSDGAIISLSMAAASLIDLTLVGHAQVKVEQFGYSDNNATAANYNTVNNQSSNSYAFDRIYNGSPQEVPQDYFTPRGTNIPNSYNNTNQQYNNTSQNSNQQTQSQYGPVPPSYDRRFQARSGGYNTPNEAFNQAPSEYGYYGNSSTNSYNNYNNPSTTYAPAYNSSNNTNNSNIPNSYSTSGNSFAWNAVNSNASNAATFSGNVEGFPTLQAGSGYSIQIGSYSQLDNVTRQALSLKNLGLTELYVTQAPAANGGRIYKIFAGRFDNRESANVYVAQIKRQFLVNGFVVRL